MTDVYTTTLGSGLELTVPVSVNFGEIIVTGVLLCFCAAAGLEFLVRKVYG